MQVNMTLLYKSQKYHDITKYRDIVVWDHVTIANSTINLKKQERQLKNGEKLEV